MLDHELDWAYWCWDGKAPLEISSPAPSQSRDAQDRLCHVGSSWAMSNSKAGDPKRATPSITCHPHSKNLFKKIYFLFRLFIFFFSILFNSKVNFPVFLHVLIAMSLGTSWEEPDSVFFTPHVHALWKLMYTSDSQTLIGSVRLWLLCAVGVFPLRAVRNQCFAWGCRSSDLSCVSLRGLREIHSRLFTLCLHRHPRLSRTCYQSQEILSRFKKKETVFSVVQVNVCAKAAFSAHFHQMWRHQTICLLGSAYSGRSYTDWTWMFTLCLKLGASSLKAESLQLQCYCFF